MTASELADALEGRREGHEWRCRCPVHGGRSLFITEKDGRILLVCRAGCSQEEVVAELKRLELWEGGSGYKPSPPEPESQNAVEKRIERADRMWQESSPITTGDPVYRYLAGRGITLTEYPEDLRTHPHLAYGEQDDAGKWIRTGTFPAMLAVVRSPQGKPVGIHRTYLTSDGHKAPVESPKKLSKVHGLTGSAVRLFPYRDGVLAVTEGLEDALSAWVLWKIPTWACLGASGMKTFEPPEEVKELMIFADNDEPGKTAATKLAGKLKRKMTVRVRIPSGHKDINQLLTEGVTCGF